MAEAGSEDLVADAYRPRCDSPVLPPPATSESARRPGILSLQQAPRWPGSSRLSLGGQSWAASPDQGHFSVLPWLRGRKQ